MMDLSDGSQSDLRSNISSSSRGGRRRVLLNRADNCDTKLMNKGEKGAADSSVIEKPDNLCIAEDFEVLKMYNEDENGLQKLEDMMDWRYGERSRMEGFQRARRMDVEGTRYATSMYLDEGPSNNWSRSNYVYEGQAKNKNETKEFNEVEYVGEDQAVILRKLDLKDKVSHSAETVDLDQVTLHRGSYVGSENWYPGSTFGTEMYSEDEGQRSDGMMDWRNGERSRIEGFRMAWRIDIEGMRYGSSMYSEKGPLNNKSSFNYDYEYPVRNKNGMDKLNKVDSVGEVGLLRKLDELKDQLSRLGELVDKAKEKVPLDRRTVHRDPYAGSDNWYSDNSFGMEIYNDDKSELQRSECMMESRNEEGSQPKEFLMGQRMDVEGTKYAASIYPEEVSSGNWSRSNDYEGQMKNKNDVDGFNKVEYNGEDRAELLSKLDELKDQLSRSSEMVPLDRRTIHQDPYVGSEKWYSDSSLEMQFLHPDKQFGRRPYPNHHAEPSTLMHRQDKDGLGFHPPRYAPIVDLIQSQMLGRGPYLPPTPFRQPPSRAYCPGEYMAQMEPYPPNVSRHHPSCSCFHCHNRQVSPPVPPTAFSNKRFSNIPKDVLFNCYKSPRSIGPREYDSLSTFPLPLKSQNPLSQRRLPSDLDSEVDDFVHSRPSRLHPVSGGQSCHPIAGGAPFLTCCYCFELLQLPKKVTSEDRKENSMKCGACSTIIAFAVSDKKLILINVEDENSFAEVNDSHVVSEP